MIPRGMLATLAVILVLSPEVGRAQTATPCDSAWREANIGAMSGRTVSEVKIVTRDPAVGPGPLALVRAAHIQTKEWVVRQLLGVEAGRPLDTLELAEGIRRLRTSKEFAHLTLEHSGARGPVSMLPPPRRPLAASPLPRKTSSVPPGLWELVSQQPTTGWGLPSAS